MPQQGGTYLMLGEALGHYRVIEKVGSGGMGEVYRAHDDQLDRDIALKVLPLGTLADDAARKLFRQEALILAKLNHPNIATIHEFGSQDGVDFLVMELIPGKSLKEIVREGPLPEKRVQRLGLQLTEGLAAAHQLGVVHRDLKPANLMVTNDGRLKILDFGLAKLLQSGRPDISQSLTKGDGFTGTLPYMAPEQLQGDSVDARTDVYATGAVLYEMTTGQRPFPETSGVRLFDFILHQTPRPPCELNPQLSYGMQAIVLKALEKDPEERFHSSKEMGTELERLSPTVAATQPFAAHTHTVQITVPEVPRWGWITLAGSILVLAALALLIPAVRDSVLHVFSGRISAPVGIPSADDKHVIVLPFDVQGDRDTLGYVAEGLGEELSRKLSALPLLHVVSASDAERQAKRQQLDLKGPIDTIARNFGVNLILRGKVLEAGGWIHITVNFDDVVYPRKSLGEEFTYAAADMKLLALEDQVYERIVRVLKLRPNGEEKTEAARPTNDDDAYDHYLKGRIALRGHTDVGGIQTAIGFYERGLKEDPRFALAYAGLSTAYLAMYDETRERTWVGEALQSAQKAERLNDSLPEVHLALGTVYQQLGKTKEAIAEFEHVKKLSPNSDQPWFRLGRTYEEAGQQVQAIDAYAKATLTNPYSLADHNDLGAAYLRYGEYQKALDQFHHVIEIDPDNYLGHMNTGVIYFVQGKYNECIPELQQALALEHSPNPDIYSDLGTAYFYKKRYAESVQLDEKAVQMRPNDQMLVGNLADAYRAAGQKKKAALTYDKAIALALQDLNVNPRNATVLGSLALYYAKKGNAASAANYIGQARSIDPKDVFLIYNEATVRVLAAQPTQAIDSLRLAFSKGLPPEQAQVDPEFSSLQKNPDFQKLVNGSRKPN